MAAVFYRNPTARHVDSGYGDAAVNPLVRLGAFYASTFLSVGLFVTFIPIHLRTLGMGAASITLIFAARQLVQSLTPPGWGLWADRRGDARLPLVVAALLNTLVFLPLLVTDEPWVLMACLIAQSGASASFSPLADSMTLTVLREAPEKFGRVRLPGSLAYGLGVLVFSLLFSRADLEKTARTSLPVIAVLLALAVLSAWLLPVVERKKLDQLAKAGNMLRHPGLWVMFLAGALHWAAHAPYNVLFGVHLQDLGVSPVVAGAALCAAVGVEMAVMWTAPRILHAVDPVDGLRLCFGVGIVRWAINAMITSPTLLVVTQGLHGITFGFFYVVCIAAVHKAVPEEARSTGQATFMALVFGAGGIVGTLVCGWAYDAGKGPLMFELSAALDVIALVLSLILGRRAAR